MGRNWRPKSVRYIFQDNPTVNFHVGNFPHSLMTEIEMFGRANRCRTFREALELVAKRGLGLVGMGNGAD